MGKHRLAVAIDYGDDRALAPELLTEYDLVFKMQYVTAGYGSDRVVPGGFVPNGLSLYRYLSHVRALRDRDRPSVDAFGRFGDDKEIEIRRHAVRLLKEQRSFRYRGGFGRVRYLESLAEAARARVCVDLPGLGPLCFRLIDYLAIGVPIVSAPHICRLHVPLEEDRHFVCCNADLSNLVDVVDALVRDPARAARIGREARTHFDRYLDYRQLARYYLTTCFDRL
jgi:glycosyltransferase involved in cell wall biosynthesis